LIQFAVFAKHGAGHIGLLLLVAIHDALAIGWVFWARRISNTLYCYSSHDCQAYSYRTKYYLADAPTNPTRTAIFW
jgi:hypothetical protein